jgi:hypothetical protein
MTLLTLLSVACCCGIPAYWGKPMWDQYPAKAALPVEVAGFDRREDSSSERAAQQLKVEMRARHVLAEDTFAGVYRDSDGKQLTIFGTTGFRFSPDKDIDEEVNRLTQTYQLVDVQPVETGVRGEYLRCGTGEADGKPVVLCIWADHGSLATGLFSRRSVDESAALLTELRGAIVSRD